MGLNITAKSKIVTKTESPEAYEFNMLLDTKVETLYINPDFPNHMNEYSSDSPDNIIEYVSSEDSKEYNFEAGSYSSFNEFRNLVCLAVNGVNAESVWKNKSKYENKPLYKFIDFSDCEGSMDSSTSKQIFEEFKANKDTFINHISSDDNVGDMDTEHHVDMYDNWIHALEIASDEGVLIFT